MQKIWQSCRSGCLIHNGTYLTNTRYRCE